MIVYILGYYFFDVAFLRVKTKIDMLNLPPLMRLHYVQINGLIYRMLDHLIVKGIVVLQYLWIHYQIVF